MSELLSSVSRMVSSLGNIKTVAEVQEMGALYKTQLYFIRDQVLKLTEESDQLKIENAKLRAKVLALGGVLDDLPMSQASTSEDDFSDDHWLKLAGAYFKRLPTGKYEEIPRCLRCRSIMTAPHTNRHIPFKCSNPVCDYQVSFKEGILNVIAELPEHE